MQRTFVVLFSFLMCLLQGREFSFEPLTSNDGLSQNDVLSIFQDSDGFMWFGTIDGLCRYDGYEFVIYRVSLKNENSISENQISFITEDKNKNLWVGTLNRGLNKFNKITGEFIHIKNTPDNPNRITDNNITCILCDSKGRIWAGTPLGINIISPKPDGTYVIQKLKFAEGDPSKLLLNLVNWIYEDSGRRIWAASNSGLYLLKNQDGNEIKNEFYEITKGTAFFPVNEIIEIPEGYLFTSSLGLALLKFNAGSPMESIIQLIDKSLAHRMAIDKEGNIWEASYHGLLRLEYRKNEAIPFVLSDVFNAGTDKNSLNNDYIRSLRVDNSGVIWIGTNGGGVSRCNPHKTKLRHYKKFGNPGNISCNKVLGIFEDYGNNIWMGTEGGGLNLLPSNKNKDYWSGFSQYDVNPPKEQNNVFDIINVSSNELPLLWAGVGYNSKIVKITCQTNNWTVSPVLPAVNSFVMCLCQDEYGSIWIGSYFNGLYKYIPNGANGRLVLYNPDNSFVPSMIIRSLLEDSKGRLWVGTSEGVALLTRDQKRSEVPEFVTYKNNPDDIASLSHNYIMPIAETSGGEIWIGTYGGGLNIYIEGTHGTDGNFKHITMEDGLPNNMIKAIVEDNEGNLWVSSNKGITRLDKKNRQIRNFDLEDGLQDMEYSDRSGIKLHDGELLFGGVNGINAFYPSEVSDDTILPKLVFTRLEIFNQPIVIGKEIHGRVLLEKAVNEISEITLKHSENDFTIHFSGLHFSAPKKNQYKYILEGYEKDWTTVKPDHRFSKYQNLDYGRYVFRFMAANSDGKWNMQAKELIIYIKPPFWKTWIFRIAILLTISGLIFLVFYLRTAQIKQRNLDLEDEVALRTREIQEKNKILRLQAEELNETNTVLEERQQKIEEQAEELTAQRDELFDANAMLEERQQEIELQRDRLAEVNSVKDKLFSIVAHDLKNPFNTLAGFLEILKAKYDKYTDEKRLMMIGHAVDSVTTIQNLLFNLLSWARSQTGNIKYNPVETNIVGLLSENIDLIEAQASEKKISTSFSCNATSIIAKIDKDLINTVVRNLLTNAIKFTPAGGKIEVLCSLKHNEISFSVKDDGIGVSEENLNKLFRKDIHFTTYGTGNEKGTGLGLITCKDFVEMHKGSISVQSVEGSGTTFTVIIPI